MKQAALLFLLFFFSSCSFFDQQARVEFDNSEKTIRVLSGNFKISNVFIREITPHKQIDSSVTSIDFEPPVKEVGLRGIKKGDYYGHPIAEMLGKQDLEYTIILKGHVDRIEIARSIVFNSKDVTTEKVFYSDF